MGSWQYLKRFPLMKLCRKFGIASREDGQTAEQGKNIDDLRYGNGELESDKYSYFLELTSVKRSIGLIATITANSEHSRPMRTVLMKCLLPT